MSEADIADLMRVAGTVIVTLAAPLLLVSLAVGLLIAVLQAITQINEATFVFVPKVISVGAVLFLLGTSMFGTLSDFTRLVIDRMIAAGGT